MATAKKTAAKQAAENPKEPTEVTPTAPTEGSAPEDSGAKVSARSDEDVAQDAAPQGEGEWLSTNDGVKFGRK